MRQLVRLLSFLIAATLLLIIGLIGYAAYEAHSFLNNPPEIPGREVALHIEQGSTFDQVARRLHENKLIANVDYFRVLGQWKGDLGNIQAGEFILHSSWLPEKILETLVSGQPRLHRLSLREGLTWWQTARVVEESGFAKAESFADAVRDSELLARHGIPFDSAEGFLFPDTYFLQKHIEQNAAEIVDLLLKSFWKQAASIWPEGRPSEEELQHIVILASLVEKETGAANERPRIAGVFANRLKRRMLLQTDVSVIYGLGLAFDGNLKRSHLEDKSNPYNTYQHPGLPPSPVCSPGLESLKAAVQPEEHKYLYFVSKQDGTHYFSKSLAEHNQAVRKYQLKH